MVSAISGKKRCPEVTTLWCFVSQFINKYIYGEKAEGEEGEGFSYCLFVLLILATALMAVACSNKIKVLTRPEKSLEFLVI